MYEYSQDALWTRPGLGPETHDYPPRKVEYQVFWRLFNELSREELDSIGYNEVVPIKREPYTTYETQWVKGEDLIYREEIVSSTVDLDALKSAKLISIQREKSRVRDGGFMVDGTLFDSDAEARVSYLELAMKLQADFTFSTQWKASDGTWVEMDTALYGQVATAGETHIAGVFAWQAGQAALIEAATTKEEIEGVSDVCA